MQTVAKLQANGIEFLRVPDTYYDEIPERIGETTLLRAGHQGLTYLAWGTREPADLVYYPTSHKLGIRGLKFRVEPLDYWDGE